MTRQEHLDWCKTRAIEEMDYSGKPSDAVVSMMSDLRKHPDTSSETLQSLCTMMLMGGQIKTRQDAVKFINGFH